MRATCAAFGLVVIAACSSGPAPGRVPPSTTVAPIAACATPTRFGASGLPTEVRGVSADGQVWGLAMGPGAVPPRPGDEVKIVWRVTGRGPLRVTFTAPDGRPRPLVFGPEPHSASTYRRPGDEWGTGFRFATRGCWHIHLARAGTTGDVWLDV